MNLKLSVNLLIYVAPVFGELKDRRTHSSMSTANFQSCCGPRILQRRAKFFLEHASTEKAKIDFLEKGNSLK
jgi:hypothetical protein